MTIRHKLYRIIICLMVLCGFIWPGSTLSDIEFFAPSEIEYQTPDLTVSFFSYDNMETVPTTGATYTPVKPNEFDIAKKPDEKNFNMEANEDTPRVLKDILSKYYEGTEVVQQEKAFKRVISWKEDFEKIADKYPNVNWQMLSAIVKAETQGKTGRQESRAKAVGISQIRYQGAWAFLWDILFRYEIKSGSGYVKDYYNANLRVRYHSQLQQIRQYLEEQRILVKPTSRSEKAYRDARSASWTNLKAHLRKKYKPGEYQVAVDIAAMYIDHLIITFQRVKHQVMEIKEYVGDNQFDGASAQNFSGVIRIRWNSIKSKLLYHKGKPNFHEITLARLNHILNSLEDPSIYSAAYNFGISKCLNYLEAGMKLPESILRYVKKVLSYHDIFNEIDIHKIYA